MAAPKEKLRDYEFPDPTLKQKADSVALSMNRDATEFATRGVTSTDITDFADQSEAFGNIDSDEEWIGIVSDAADAKNTLRSSLENQIGVIRNIAEIGWGLKSPKYRRFGFLGMAALTDNKLFRCAKRVKKVGTLQLADLSASGLTNTMLATLNTTITDFDEAIDTADDAVRDRDIAQQNRVEAGNALYTNLVKYCSIGKSLWANDLARFNDYVIYDTPSGSADSGSGATIVNP